MREWEEQILSHIKNMLFYLVFLNVNIYIFNTTIVMIDDKKIEAAANKHIETEYARYNSGEVEEEMICLRGKDSFKEGAKWGINELLKDLFHPASEVPRNDNGKVLAFSKEFGYRKLYDMNDELDKTTCDTYKEMWEEQVYMFQLSDWIFVDELFDLIIKGGEQ